MSFPISWNLWNTIRSRCRIFYESLAIRYRQEPYRLKLAYILKRLENTRDRNDKLYNSNFLDRDILNSHNPATAYLSGDEFLAELRLINRNLKETGLELS